MKIPPKCISVESAKQLQETWRETRGKYIARAQAYKDTREFWYSVEELQEYLDYVKEKSKEQGIENPGIRIYLGAYPNSKQKNGFSTIFLSPTKPTISTGVGDSDSQENNYEIEPLNTTTGGMPPKNY